MAAVNIEVKAQVDDAIRGLGKIKTSFNDFDTANRDAAGALGTFGISLSSLNSPITAVASGIKASIDTTMQWGETIDKLTRATGLSAEQASKMAVVLGDFGIQADGLDKVVKTFTKNGLQFNLDTIKKLAVEYQAIKDPVERDKFAFDNFGKSGLEMNEILSKSPAELQAVGDAADYSGKIMSGAGVEAVQQFGIKTAELTDKLDGLKIAIGGPLINTLSSAVDGFTGLIATINAVDIAVEVHTGMITYDEAAARADAAAHGDLFAAFKTAQPVIEAQAPVIERLKEDTLQLADNTNASATAYENQIPQINLSASSVAALSLAVDTNNAKVTEANTLLAVQDGMMGELTSQMIFQAAASHLDAEGQAELAVKLGLMNNVTFTAIQTVEAINTKLDNHTISVDAATTAEANLAAQNGLLTGTVAPQIAGLIALHNKMDVQTSDFNTVAGAAANVTTNIHGIIAAEDALKDKSITITTIYQHYGEQSGENAGMPNPGRASGGPVSAGIAYTVGESGPETFVPRSNGTILPNGAATGGANIYIDARGSSDPGAVEAAGYRGAVRALAEAGYRADQLARMGTY